MRDLPGSSVVKTTHIAGGVGSMTGRGNHTACMCVC